VLTTTRLLGAVLIMVPACALATVLAVRKMLNACRDTLAGIIKRRFADLTVHLDGTEEGLKGHAEHHLGVLAGSVEGLADATRAVLMSQAPREAPAPRKSSAAKKGGAA
jgi:hypothetical protein